MDIRGKGGINLHVIGTPQNPHGWGKFWFNDATVSFNDIKNMTLTNGSGVLEFDNQNTVFKTNSAKLNGKPISVNGTCSLLGNLNFNVLTQGQDFENILKIVKTSPMLADVQKLIDPVENGKGAVNFKLNLTGQVKDPKDIVFNKNLFAKGSLELFSNTIKLKGIPVAISQTSGNINFDNLDADLKLNSNLNNSQLNIDGKIKDTFANVKVVSNKFNLGDCIKTLTENTKVPYKNDISSINTSFIAKYSGLILIHHPRTAQIPSRITHIQSFMKSHSLKSIFHRKSYRLLPHNHYFFLHHFSFILNDYILSIFHCSFYGRMKRITSM